MADKPIILVVDDDRNTRDGLALALKRHYDVHVAESGEKALELFASGLDVDVMLSDMRMPGMKGLDLLRTVKKLYPQTTCILLTAYGTIAEAVEAMRDGAYNFLTKPISLDQLDVLLAQAIKARSLEKRVQTLESQLDEKFGLENIVGNSEAMRPVFETIRQVAPTLATVLIQGPSGTGKELVAHAIHRLSQRADKPFVAVNCAALPASLLESELFGHERGAFTGAVQQRKGRFEQANGGTLFLDEISEIEPAVQVKLLRVLEARQFERVGGTDTIEVDIRVIAATNRNLRDYVTQGRFREDLFYRLNVVGIQLPPLKDRIGDIPLLVQQFLTDFCERNNKHLNGIEPEALNILCAYDWPGNVRELRNAMERMVVLSRGDHLTVQDVPMEIRSAAGARIPSVTTTALTDTFVNGSLADAEKQKILAVLEKNGGNRSKAAIELGISRRTLHRRLNEWGITKGEADDLPQ
ncbi:MAG: sigma-54-dependent Fis family transcriptional regulator [Kiritimatiellae bacterium]|nr:sigma-54-dependent Fis family transcriptional regulator [Kiritimatiellia bacterium]